MKRNFFLSVRFLCSDLVVFLLDSVFYIGKEVRINRGWDEKEMDLTAEDCLVFNPVDLCIRK